MSALAWRHELRLMQRERATLVLLVLWLLALPYALSTGWQLASQTRAQTQAFETAASARIDQQRAAARDAAAGRAPQNPFAGAPSSVRAPAVLPVSPAAFLAVGEMDLRPHTATVSLFTGGSASTKNHELQSSATLAQGRFDLSFAVVTLMPLLLIALTHALLAQDRERQRLAPLAAQGSVAGLAVRRLLLRAAVVVLPLVAVTGVATWFAAAPGAASAWLAWIAAAVAYSLFWTGICAWVAVRAQRVDPAAGNLAAAWLGILVFLPALMAAALQSLAPPPSPLHAVSAARAAEVQAERERERILGAYVSDHPELKVSTAQDGMAWTRRYYTQLQFIARQLEPVHAADQAMRERARALQARWAWLSPAGLAEHALERAAGTDAHHYDDWLLQVQAFKPRWDASLVAPLMQGRSLGAADFDTLPQFSYRAAAAAAPFGAVSWLVAWGAGLAWLAFRPLRRAALR
jgi:ABC-2 type transport system permease protein